MHKNGFFPDNFVIPNVLKDCSALQLIGFGKGVHGYALKMELYDCVYVASSLVDMYGKCGSLVDARKIFDGIYERNVVTWNSMIVGYVQNRINEEAMKVFYDMIVEGVEPTRVTLPSFLSASVNLDAIEEGRQGHAVIVLRGLELDNILGNSLINFYSKTHEIEDIEFILSRIKERDTVSWNLLISCYVQEGQVEEALDTCRRMRSENFRLTQFQLLYYVHLMRKEGIKPEASSAFTGVLSACSHRRFLDEGLEVFSDMVSGYSIKLNMEH
ncbi:hypothetical protein GIB67_030643 [Kingdonia uniflora]|uniref:Pentatricopeptide repeat-containing protein n=1 Tax=Kingdonia uniflora TaxID=39325 RepID=A0A7J7NIW2_9MAGN|nr:hypothetical protein GIB67_030643 [Kingdonia uniflora]